MRWKLVLLSSVALFVATLGSPSSFDNAIVPTEGSVPNDAHAVVDQDEEQLPPSVNGLQPAVTGFSPIYEEEDSCALKLQRKFNCTEEACADLVPGYINYLDFFYCTADNIGLQILTFLLFLLWMAFLLHLVETTTNDYFCASLTLAVDILKLSPNVAGVTFLAVGNAACDVIASIAAFSTGVPKVGIGTTVGAGIFVTTAVIAVVSFVADVRLARRSFVRDILFFIFTVVYLLVVSADGFIDLGESVGFIVIYIVFVLVVGGARYIRLLHSPEEDAHGLSLAGSTGEEGTARRLSVEIMDAKFEQAIGGTYNAPVEKPQLGLVADNRDRSISDVRIMSRALDHDVESAVPDIHKDMLHALDAARAQALEREREKDMKKLKSAKYFAQAEAEDEYNDNDDDEEEEDGDLGGGSGDASTRIRNPGEDETGFPGASGNTQSFMESLPAKPSRWTRQFLKTQQEAGPAYAPFQWTKYHKKTLAKELAARLRARGTAVITTTEGNTVDFIELLAKDPDAAAELAASIGTAVTAAAQKKFKPLTFEDARAAASGATRPTVASLQTNKTGGISSTAQPAGEKVKVPVMDVLAILPHETIKPIANMFTRLKNVFNRVQPYYHGFMHVMELPIQGLRKLSVPLLHEGAYRRRWMCIVMPFMTMFMTIVLTTHVLKGSATSVGGFPYWVLGFLLGGVLGVVFHFTLPKNPSADVDEGSSVSLLAKESHQPEAHHGHKHKRPWYKKIGIMIAGPNTHPLPQKPILYTLLVLSFVMALFWLLIIANEIVGTAIFIGKVLNVPDIVMGLTVLAVGNSINDLAASLTIARDGYASMAVAGAYAGPMFNVLAGIGLPMLISTAKTGVPYNVGPLTPLVITSFVALLFPLMVTLIWVPLVGWRITHRIGRFLCVWFFTFIIIVLIVGFGGLSKGDVVTLGG